MAEKRGLPKGLTNNPNGRPKGSKNRFSFDVRTFIYDNVSNDRFIKDIFTDIDAIEEADKRAKLKLELIKLFVPRPLNIDEQKDKDIKSAIWEKLSGQAKDEDGFSNTSKKFELLTSNELVTI
jgi:hypothetical protein